MNESRCVFCEIVEGTEDARVVYESDSVIAMIDPRQENPGHILAQLTSRFALRRIRAFACRQPETPGRKPGTFAEIKFRGDLNL